MLSPSTTMSKETGVQGRIALRVESPRWKTPSPTFLPEGKMPLLESVVAVDMVLPPVLDLSGNNNGSKESTKIRRIPKKMK